MSTIRAVSYTHLDVYKRQVTGSPVKVLGKVDVRVCLGLLEFSHQMVVADIVDEVILSIDIMSDTNSLWS